MSAFADADELRFREDIEPIGDPTAATVSFIQRKELTQRIEETLFRAAIAPAGRIVELGAGSCWLSAWLATDPAVERVIAVEFSRRRLTELAPVALAYFETPPGKVERLVADFHVPHLPDASVDLVVTDAAFHHASQPDEVARVAFAMLRPGGAFLLHREATVTLVRRWRDHGLEGLHGSFEHDHRPADYLRILRRAGFEAKKIPVSSGFRSQWRRAQSRPPLSWFNAIAWGWYAFVGRKPTPS